MAEPAAEAGSSSDDGNEREIATELGVVARGLERAMSSRFASTMASQWVQRGLGDSTVAAAISDRSHALSRVLEWLQEVGGVEGEGDHAPSVKQPQSQWQRGCPEVIPGLRASPFWVTATTDRSSLPPQLAFIRDLEAAADDIRAEILALRGRAVGFQRYRAPTFTASTAATADTAAADAADTGTPLGAEGTDAGQWNVLYFQLHSAEEEAGCAAARAACPRTAAVLDALPRPYQHAMVSALAPGTHIPTHTGPTNKKLRVQLPLVVPPAGSRLRAGPHTASLVEGRVLVFDDSFQHEAWNDDATHPRIILIADIWHPDLSDAEVKLLSLLRSSAMRQARALSAAGQVAPAQDFFSVLRDARLRGADEAAVFGTAAVPEAAAAAAAAADGDGERAAATGAPVLLTHAVPVRDD